MNNNMYAIFPYLKTHKPVTIRGIQFFPGKKLDENTALSEEDKLHLQRILPLFYLKNELAIETATYTVKPVSVQTVEQINTWIQRLREARTLLSFLYSSPHFPHGDPFLLSEHADIYLLWPKLVPKSLVGFKKAERWQEKDYQIEGYEGVLNFHTYFWTAPNCRLYPALPSLWLNLEQDISRDLNFGWREYQWSILQLLYSDKPIDENFEERIFTAMQWCNRSTSGYASETVALVHLAIAFECLFAFEQEKDITAKFKEYIVSLLGKIQRLDSWIEQFYKARSKIVHQGNWEHLEFYATDAKHYQHIVEGKDSGVRFRRLTAYGWRIFRLCLNTILAGHLAAYQTGLRSLLQHNQDRLQSIRQKLDSQANPLELLKQVATEVFELNQYWLDSEHTTDLKTVLTTGRVLIKKYLDTNPTLPEDVSTDVLMLMTSIVDNTTLDDTQQIEQYDKLWDHLERKYHYYEYQDYVEIDPLVIISQYGRYVADSAMWLRAQGISFR